MEELTEERPKIGIKEQEKRILGREIKGAGGGDFQMTLHGVEDVGQAGRCRSKEIGEKHTRDKEKSNREMAVNPKK